MLLRMVVQPLEPLAAQQVAVISTIRAMAQAARYGVLPPLAVAPFGFTVLKSRQALLLAVPGARLAEPAPFSAQIHWLRQGKPMVVATV